MKSAKKIFFSISVLIVSMALIINFTSSEQPVEINDDSNNDKVIRDKDVTKDLDQNTIEDETPSNDYKSRSRTIEVEAKNTLMDRLTNGSELKIVSDEGYTQEELIKKITTYPKVSFMIREEDDQPHIVECLVSADYSTL